MVRDKWDAVYREQRQAKPDAALVLAQNQHLLPIKGNALDLACGLGANALLLAKQGLKTSAWDISAVAIEQLNAKAERQGLAIDAVCCDVTHTALAEAAFDVIVVSFYLQRSLCPAIQAALKPGGLLFYQTFCQQKVSQTGPRNPDFLLADNELLDLFPALKLRVYREEALLGDHQMGLRNQALMVAEKPSVSPANKLLAK